MNPTGRRTPVRLHRNVSLLRAGDALMVEELLSRKPVARCVVGRLSDTVLLVRAEDEAVLLEELRRIGQMPRLAEGDDRSARPEETSPSA